MDARTKMISAGSALWGLAVPALVMAAASSPACAREPRYPISIPAGPLRDGLSRLSAATGVSIGLSGDLPRQTTNAVSGTLSADEALRRMLSGTGLRAVRVGPTAFRLDARAPAPAKVAPLRPLALSAVAAALPDIIVTAQKRPQPLDAVPYSLAVTSFDAHPGGVVAPASRDIALGLEGLALTNLGPGRNRQFIRGVADSPFNGPSQSTVAVEIDDARVTFDAPDPDLRLVDVERVEILKGPQGPLYGSGALGGIYHIVTRRPDLSAFSLDAGVTSEAVQHGSIGGGADATVNVPIITDRLALRAVGYALWNGGWIDNAGRKADSNSARTLGARLALRWQPGPGWTIDVGGLFQNLDIFDSQYVLASDDTLSRTNPIAEPNDNYFRVLRGRIEKNFGSLTLVSATSYVDHAVDYQLDASPAAAAFGLSGPTIFKDDRDYAIFNQEVRLSSTGSGRWLVGLSYMQASSHAQSTLSDASGASVPAQTLDRHSQELAMFGEGSIGLAPRLETTLGARLFYSRATDETTERSGQRVDRIGKLIFSPSLALSWTPQARTLVFLRYARTERPGGLAPSGSGIRRFDSDDLGTLDLGMRRHSADGRLMMAASLYYTVWDNIQSDYLLANGLISTRNAGRGQIIGAEASIDWAPGGGFDVAAGVTAQNARLTHAADGLELEHRRLPIAPDISARLALARRFDLGDWRARLSAQANYTGSARLTFDEDLDRQMGKYAVLALEGSVTRGRTGIRLRIDNLMDIEGDSFAFGNPFSIRNGPQYTPLRPRTLTLSIGRSW